MPLSRNFPVIAFAAFHTLSLCMLPLAFGAISNSSQLTIVGGSLLNGSSKCVRSSWARGVNSPVGGSVGWAASGHMLYVLGCEKRSAQLGGYGSNTNMEFCQLYGYDMLRDMWFNLTTSATAEHLPPLAGDDNVPMTSANRKLYTFGGRSGSLHFEDLHEYDISAARWTRLSDLSGGKPPSARTKAGMASVAGKIYVHGGVFSTTFFADLYEYDPATSMWAELSPSAGMPPSPRADHGITVWDNKIYIYAGWGPKSESIGAIGNLDDLHAYDVAERSWTSLGSGPVLGNRVRVAAMDGRIYTFGGYPFNNRTREYDIEQGAWRDLSSSLRGSAPDPRFAALVAWDQKLFVVGGVGKGGVSSFDAFYDVFIASLCESPAAAQKAGGKRVVGWRELPSNLRRRVGLGAVFLDGLIWVFGGALKPEHAAPVNDLDSYSVADGTWTNHAASSGNGHGSERGAAPSPRTLMALAALEGSLYVFGGILADGSVDASFFRFDVATLTWHPVAQSAGWEWPPKRAGGALQGAGQRLFLFGGSASARAFEALPSNAVWSYSVGAGPGGWEEMLPTSTQSTPSQRWGHSMMGWDGQLFLHGGGRASARLYVEKPGNDVAEREAVSWRFNTSQASWHQLPIASHRGWQAPGVWGHSMAAQGGWGYVFGGTRAAEEAQAERQGRDASERERPTGAVMELSLGDAVAGWEELLARGRTPSARTGAALVAGAGRLYVVGGDVSAAGAAGQFFEGLVCVVGHYCPEGSAGPALLCPPGKVCSGGTSEPRDCEPWLSRPVEAGAVECGDWSAGAVAAVVLAALLPLSLLRYLLQQDTGGMARCGSPGCSRPACEDLQDVQRPQSVAEVLGVGALYIGMLAVWGSFWRPTALFGIPIVVNGCVVGVNVGMLRTRFGRCSKCCACWQNGRLAASKAGHGEGEGIELLTADKAGEGEGKGGEGEGNGSDRVCSVCRRKRPQHPSGLAAMCEHGPWLDCKECKGAIAKGEQMPILTLVLDEGLREAPALSTWWYAHGDHTSRRGALDSMEDDEAGGQEEEEEEDEQVGKRSEEERVSERRRAWEEVLRGKPEEELREELLGEGLPPGLRLELKEGSDAERGTRSVGSGVALARLAGVPASEWKKVTVVVCAANSEGVDWCCFDLISQPTQSPPVQLRHPASETRVSISNAGGASADPPRATASHMKEAEQAKDGDNAAGDGVSGSRVSSREPPNPDEATLENVQGGGVVPGEAREGTVQQHPAGQQAQTAEPVPGRNAPPRLPQEWGISSLGGCLSELWRQGSAATATDDKKTKAELFGHDLSTASACSEELSQALTSGPMASGPKTKAGRLLWLRETVKGIDKSEVGGQRDDRLGTGGQAVLWKGSYNRIEVAVKEYTAFRADDEARTEERALTEAVLLYKISKAGCAAVVQCHGVVEVQQGELRELRLVLELAPQGSLDAILYSDRESGALKTPRFWKPADGAWDVKRREYVEARQLGWLFGIAEGLRFLHSNGLTHCDVKANNVLLFDDGRTPKLGDLGSCVLERNFQSPLHGSQSCATGRNEMWTRRYAAPERLEREHGAPITRPRDGQVAAQPPADVWSFGLLAFEILFAEKVWKDIKDSDHLRLEQAQKAGMTVEQMAPRELCVRDPRVALRGIDGMLEKCWARKPADRLKMAEVLTFLVTLQSPAAESSEPTPQAQGLRDDHLLATSESAAAESSETPHLVVSQEEELCDDSHGKVRAVLPPGCGVVFPKTADHSLAALRVHWSTPTSAMIAAAAQPTNKLADGSHSSFLVVGHALDYQPSGTSFTSPITLRLPVWADFLRQLKDEDVVFRLGVFTWDERDGVWIENPGSCRVSGSEAEARVSTFCIKVVGAILESFKFCGPFSSLWRTPLKFLAVAPVLEDVHTERLVILYVRVLEGKLEPDELGRELRDKTGKYKVVGHSHIEVSHAELPTKASIEVHQDRHDDTKTLQAFTRVPYEGQCRLKYVPGESAQSSPITGSVVVSYESEVDPPTPHVFFFDIECGPAAREKGEPRSQAMPGALPASCKMESTRKTPQLGAEEAIAPGQVEPRVVPLKPREWKETRPPRIYAFYSACADDGLGLEMEAKKQAQAVFAQVHMVYEVSCFPLSTFTDFHEQMIRASDRRTEIVHFSGHGGDKGGLRFVEGDAADSSKEESLKTIANVFQCESKEEGGSVECVVLNACDTEQLGMAIRERGVPYVLCWRGKVPDEVATLFATWFYKSLQGSRQGSTTGKNPYEKAFKDAEIEVERRREEMEMSAPRGRIGASVEATPFWKLVFLQGRYQSEKTTERTGSESTGTRHELESPDGIGCSSEDSSEGQTRSLTNRKGEAELEAFEALGVVLEFPTNATHPSRIRDNVNKYFNGMLRSEQLARLGLEETAYEYSNPKKTHLKLKHLRLTNAALQALFQPEKLGCRPIEKYAHVFAEDGPLMRLARMAKPMARKKALRMLGESLQLRNRDLQNPTPSAGFNGHYHMAMAIKECWEHLGKLVADRDTVVCR